MTQDAGKLKLDVESEVGRTRFQKQIAAVQAAKTKDLLDDLSATLRDQ